MENRKINRYKINQSIVCNKPTYFVVCDNALKRVKNSRFDLGLKPKWKTFEYFFSSSVKHSKRVKDKSDSEREYESMNVLNLVLKFE